jgi:proline dehydrogenase
MPSAPKRRNRTLFPQSPDLAARNLDNLLAEVAFGAYWHDDFYKTMPSQLKAWGTSVATEKATTEDGPGGPK